MTNVMVTAKTITAFGFFEYLMEVGFMLASSNENKKWISNFVHEKLFGMEKDEPGHAFTSTNSLVANHVGGHRPARMYDLRARQLY